MRCGDCKYWDSGSDAGDDFGSCDSDIFANMYEDEITTKIKFLIHGWLAGESEARFYPHRDFGCSGFEAKELV